jgi:hypothetical protein
MRRSWLLQTALLGLALSLAGIVWLTYHPDSEILQRATRLPGVGPLAERIQKTYLPAPASRSATPGVSPSRESHSGAAAPGAVRPSVEIDWEAVEAHPFEWFVAGTTVHEGPAGSSKVLFTLDNPAPFALRQRQGDWARIRVGARDAWIRVDSSTVSSEPPLGRAPAAVTAVEGRPPDPRRLARAIETLGAGARTLRLGPYALYTDLPDGPLLSFLDRVARHHEESYCERYRLSLRGRPEAAVVLFSDAAAYRRFQEDDARLSGLRASGHAGYGIAALFTAGLGQEEIAGTLIHELSHLTNRRAVGPALPPWLDEGLAEDLAGLAVGPDGRVIEGTWRGERSADAGQVRWTGTLADLKQVEDSRARGELSSLPELLSLEWEPFVRTEVPRLRYAHGALWIRFLLRPEGDLGDAFRAFLAGVATGEPPSPEALRRQLGRSWQELEGEFRSWIQEQAARTDADLS